MNDPNGPICWRGQFHMFYQYNPEAAVWGDMHWAHAVSPDMLHWRHLPIALSPQPNGPDSAGCFTGTAVPHDNGVAVLYTGVVELSKGGPSAPAGAHVFKESQCLATSSDPELIRWTQDPVPVIAGPPPGLEVTGFRDPVPWREGDVWYMIVGSGIRLQGGIALLYRSPDLRHWEYLHRIAFGSPTGSKETDPVGSGDMWECPDFFRLGDKHVLIYSTQGKSFWQTGTLDTAAMVFHHEREGVLDPGCFYAPKTQLDPGGRRILWGWIRETRPEAEYRAAGWAGVMSLPRVLTLDPRGDLRIALLPEFDKLRDAPRNLQWSGDESSGRDRLARMVVRGACGEITLSFQRKTEPLDFSLVSPERSAPWLACRYDPARPGAIRIDDQFVPLGPLNDKAVELRFLIDGSVIECFANGYGASTNRFYAPGSSAPAIGVQIPGPLSRIVSLSVSQIKPISANRLTT
jgi:beta-fructofuranosidase